MAITSSTFVIDAHAQKDGSRYVKETHTDSEGRTQHTLYKLPAGQGDAEAQAKMTARIAYLNDQLAAQEFEELIGGD